MGNRLGEGKADTSDLKRKDKGVRFIAGAWGRPGGEDGSDGRIGLGQFERAAVRLP